MDPIRIVLLKHVFRQNSKFESGRAKPSQKKWASVDPCGPPGSATYEPTQHLVLLDSLFVLFQVKRGAIFQFTVVPFDFCLISNIFSCRYACITLE